RRSLFIREPAGRRLPSSNFDSDCWSGMSKLRSLIIDDEPNARMRLRRLLSDDDRVEVIGEAKDGLEAVAEIQRLTPDLVFLDVQMPGLDGSNPPKARHPELTFLLSIFVTAF